jgi:hypothetical protein
LGAPAVRELSKLYSVPEKREPLECGVEPFRANTPLWIADHLSVNAARDSASDHMYEEWGAQAQSKAARAPLWGLSPHSKGWRFVAAFGTG